MPDCPITPRLHRPFLHRLVLVACWLSAADALRAESLTNADVPSTMNGGASTYTLDAFSREWGSVTTVYIGSNTANNTFTIQNGASASSTSTATIGISIGDTAAATGNAAIVTGAGSSWSVAGSSSTRGYLYVGNLGSNNSLTVTLGAEVNSNRVVVGNLSTGNSITISQGGVVNTNSGFIGAGRNDSTTYGSNNTAVVTGAGSSWTNTGTFNIGGGSNNSLTVSAGAYVSGNSTTVGTGQSVIEASFGNYNTVLVTGVGTRWENIGTTGRTTTGASGNFNSFTLTAGATAESRQFVVGDGNSLYATLGRSNTTTIEGASTLWTVESYARVGIAGSENLLLIRDGAKFETGTSGTRSEIGFGVGDTSAFGNANTVTIEGANSWWQNRSAITVGTQGSGNTLQVLAGGKFTSGSETLEEGIAGTIIGATEYASNNRILVSGLNSLWESTGSLTIGLSSNAGNALTLEDHGLAMIGDDATDLFSIAAGNFVQLDGGYLALFGDQQSLIANLAAQGSLQIKQGGVWTSASIGDFQFAYFAPGTDTAEFTGGSYGGLGGYTLVTAIPEPSSAGLLILGLAALTLRRRKR